MAVKYEVVPKGRYVCFRILQGFGMDEDTPNELRRYCLDGLTDKLYCDRHWLAAAWEVAGTAEDEKFDVEILTIDGEVYVSADTVSAVSDQFPHFAMLCEAIAACAPRGMALSEIEKPSGSDAQEQPGSRDATQECDS